MFDKTNIPHAGEFATATYPGGYVVAVEGWDSESGFLSVYQLQSKALYAFRDPVPYSSLNTRIKLAIKPQAGDHEFRRSAAEYHSNEFNQFHSMAEKYGGADDGTGCCKKHNLEPTRLDLMDRKALSQILPE